MHQKIHIGWAKTSDTKLLFLLVTIECINKTESFFT